MNSSVGPHFEDWDLFVLAALDENEMRQMADHLEQGCATCSSQLSAVEAVLACLAVTGEDIPLSKGAEGRLLDRLGIGKSSGNPSMPRSVRSAAWFPGFAPWVLTALCLLAVVALSSELCRLRRPFNTGNNGTPEQILLLQNRVRDLEAEKAQSDQSLQTAQRQLALANLQVIRLQASLKQARYEVLRFGKEKPASAAVNERIVALLDS